VGRAVCIDASHLVLAGQSMLRAAQAASLWHGQVHIAEGPSVRHGQDSPSPPCYRGWREVQRYIAEGPAHLVAQHGRDFATGAALLAAVVAGAPIGDVPAFVVARTDGGGGGGGGTEDAAGGPCVSPGAVELLLRELAALPLNKVLGISCCTATTPNTKAACVTTHTRSMRLFCCHLAAIAARAQSSLNPWLIAPADVCPMWAVPLQVVSGAAPAQGSGLPLLAARLCFLLLLVPPAAWDAIPNEQVATTALQS
jgi:hypothetical protein